MKVTVECNHLGLIRIVQEVEHVSADWEKFQIDPYHEDVSVITEELGRKVHTSYKEFEERIDKVIDELMLLDECVQPIS